MDEQLANRISSHEPSEPLEKIFWGISEIHRLRTGHWSPRSLEPKVRELADVVEAQYIDWLRAQGVQGGDGELSQYLYLVLPYLSFRLLNGPASKEIDLCKVSASQKNRFIDLMVEELHELPDNPFLRAMMKESLKTLLVFLENLRCRREH